MKKSILQILTLIMALLMLVSGLPVAGVSAVTTDTAGVSASTYDEYYSTNDKYKYSINNGEITIMEYIGSDTEVQIPSEIEGLPVTEIYGAYRVVESEMEFYEGAFKCNYNITSVTIPSSVKVIGDYAFEYCENLRSINIPSSVISIGEDAFNGTNCLKWKNGVYYIDNALIEVPYDISGEYNISEGTTVIAKGAFRGLSNLTSVTIPASITRIDDYVFRGCDELASVKIPLSVTSIGKKAFSETGLTSVVIPPRVNCIEARTFSGCSFLSSVVIPDSITSINQKAFDGCDSLTDIKFCGTEAQWNDIAVESGNDVLSNVNISYDGKILPNGLVYDGSTADEWTIIDYVGNEDVLIIPSEIDGKPVTTISEGVFAGSEILRVHIPDTITTIENNAFTVPSAHIFYEGTIDQWKAIDIADGNDVLFESTRHYDVSLEYTTTAIAARMNSDEFHVVAGAPELCGSNWDPADTNNQMFYNPEKDIYEKIYTDVAAGTYEFKVTTGGAWENGDFNLEGIAMFGGANASVTVKNDGSTVIVGFNGMHATVEVVEGDIHLTAKLYSSEVTVPTCQEGGYTTHTCRYCDDSYVTDYTSVLEHDYVSKVVAPTCNSQGYTLHSCIYCENSYKSDYVDVVEHYVVDGYCIYCLQSFYVVESEHDYAANTDKTWTISEPNAKSLELNFSADTLVEKNYDFIYIYDGNDNLVGKYTGTALASQRIVVSGSVAKIRLTSDASNQYYGFRVEYTYENKYNSDTITIYFTNNWNFADQYVHYWGSEIEADSEWPGIPMTFVETNEVGEDIYSAEVPADATGIVFSGLHDQDPNTRRQTVDITEGLVDNAGFYCKEELDGKITVGTYTYEPPTDVPTDAPATEDEPTDAPTSDDEPTVAPTEESSSYPVIIGVVGDVNGDNKVNIRDASVIQKYCVRLVSLDEVCLNLGDTDRNGVVNIKDASVIQKYCVGIDTGCPVGEYLQVNKTF